MAGSDPAAATAGNSPGHRSALRDAVLRQGRIVHSDMSPRTVGVVAVVFVVLGVMIAASPAIGEAQTPTYISSMSAYQVRALTGSFAPTNGQISMRSVTPAEWLTNDPG